MAKISDSIGCRAATTMISDKTVNFYEIVKVDGRSVASSSEATLEKGSFTFTPTLLQRNVPAQKCVLTLRATQIREQNGSDYHDEHFAGPRYLLEGEITVELDPDKEYVVTGNLSLFGQSVFLQSLDQTFTSAKIEWHGKAARKHLEQRPKDRIERFQRDIERK